jgi:diaminopimelate epimerase
MLAEGCRRRRYDGGPGDGAVRFTKVEGAGNDYVLVDETNGAVADPRTLARRLSDRHQGVGSDGLLLVGPGSDAYHASMRIFNADGSEGRMCGNGLRCVVRYLYERRGGLADELLIETAAGTRRGRREPDGSIWVHMGEPNFKPSSLPVALPGDGRMPAELPLPRELLGSRDRPDPHVAFAVSIGNPHLVVRLSDPDRADLEHWGRCLQASELLGDGANVHLVGLRGGRLVARPYERGSGATRACGTGAVAVAAVARRLGWVSDDETTVCMPGGDLPVRWPGSGDAWLGGSASLVFDGELHAP